MVDAMAIQPPKGVIGISRPIIGSVTRPKSPDGIIGAPRRPYGFLPSSQDGNPMQLITQGSFIPDEPLPPGSPELWFAAGKETAYADGDPVSAMTNFGSLGASANMSQGSPSLQPTYRTPLASGLINDSPGIVFDGTEQIATAAFAVHAQPNVIAIVIRDRAEAFGAVFDGLSFGTRNALFQRGTKFELFAGSALRIVHNRTLDVLSMLVCTFDGASSFSRKDATASSTVSPGGDTLAGFQLGGSPFGDRGTFELVEVLGYLGGNVSYGALTDIEAFFEAKYGSFPQS